MSSTKERTGVIEMVAAGGPVMIPIGLCSVVAFAMFLERLWALRQSNVLPRSLLVKLNACLREGRFDDAVEICRDSPAAAGRLMEVAIRSRHRSRADIKERLEEVGRREAAEMERGIPVIGTIASIAPLLGLLGTVGGMILTFSIISTEGLGDVASLAGGISQALITTFAGLTVGIPAVVANRFLLSRVDAMLLSLEELSLEVMDRLTDRPPTGEGE